jgi:broad specificity phosphatase PhoE
MTTTIHLVRHGEVHNPQGIFYGRLPRFGLSATGRAQAEAARDFLATRPWTALYTSPLLRARQTATIIAQSRPGLKPCRESRLTEILSPYEGQPYAVLEAIAWDLFRDVAPPYENAQAVVDRLQSVCYALVRRHTGQEVVAVTHGALVVFAQLWGRGLAFTYANERSIQPYPATASINSLIFDSLTDRPRFEYHKPY